MGGDPEPATSNVAELLSAAARRFPERAALLTSGGVRTWADVDRATEAGVRDVSRRGLVPRSRVVVMLPTGDDIVAVLFALARAGLVAVPLNPSRTTLPEVSALVQPALLIGPVDDGLGTPRLDPSELAAWWSAGPDAEPVAAVGSAGGEDLALLARAGTDRPLVMLSHRSMLAAVAAIGAAPQLRLRSDDRALIVLPLYHLAGWVTAFLPLAAVGAAAVIPDVPDTAGVWIDAVLTTAHDRKVTILPAAPTLYRRLRTASGVERSLSTVRLMTSGAASLDPEDFAAVRSHTGQSVWEGYGISESASVVATSLMTTAARAGSVGLPLPGIELRILPDGEQLHDVPDGKTDADPSGDMGTPAKAVERDPTAEVVGDGEVGRIAIRGATLFSGYWPEGDGGPDDAGWFVTEDVGYFDDLGQLHLVDRAGESLHVAGFTVYAREVENALAGHPYVRDAAVIGVPGRAGEVMVAVLVPQRGTRPTPDDVSEFLASRLPAFKRPTRYRLVDRLPRNEIGRVDRALVRRRYLDDPDPEPAPSVRLATVTQLEETDSAAAPSPSSGAGPSRVSGAVTPDGQPGPPSALRTLGARLSRAAGRVVSSAGGGAADHRSGRSGEAEKATPGQAPTPDGGQSQAPQPVPSGSRSDEDLF